MIDRIRLQNFRGFEDHSLPFGPMTVVVGQNNAGKTTIVEALRILSMVTLRYRNLTFRDPPSTCDLPRRNRGLSPSLKGVEINFDTIFHRYSRPPAIITATFSGGASIAIYILKGSQLHAVLADPSGKILTSRAQAAHISLPAVQIMPQVAPLQRKEEILSPDYVRSAMSSRLAPLHFRNQLNLQYGLFPDFAELVADTWPGVQVKELIGQGGLPGKDLHLEIRNEDFVAEIAEMGHGLQMWLQTIWFLTLAKDAATIILDEPDVYMHADLQRRITRLLRNRHTQTILTTHSVEIMSEVTPEEILVVDKRRKESSFAGSLPVIQAAIDRCGSVHNIHLTRLLGAHKFLLFEGKDIQLLKILQDALFPNTKAPLLSVPYMAIGGWTGWKFAVGSSMAFHNSFGDRIRTYCILDSDYHTPDEVTERYGEAHREGVDLHIWEHKEIENYLLCSRAIARFIAKGVAKRTTVPTANEIHNKLLELSECMKDEVLDAIATDLCVQNRRIGQTGANRGARQRMNAERGLRGNLLWLVSGKKLLSALSGWSKNEFGVSFGPSSIAKEMRAEEIPAELAAVLSAIEECQPFPTANPRTA